jgi:hypothetical protein
VVDDQIQRRTADLVSGGSSSLCSVGAVGGLGGPIDGLVVFLFF